MADTVIRVDGLGKLYQIGPRENHQTLRESLMAALRRPWRGLLPVAAPHTDPSQFWALRNVSFEVSRGEVVGIIGRNGAGKTTLLKLLSRISEPTEGRAEICGRVGSLLEVGTGFHPELTGRENIYLNGAILGMPRSETSRKFDEIVAFSEIEKFLDTPVKRYSSGMYMRLAFAVAAHLEPDVLIVDEVLAVGDAAFQRKCLGKMGDVASQGRTVLFVSHNMAAVQGLCSRGIVLHTGGLTFDGPAADAVGRYLASACALGQQDAPGHFKLTARENPLKPGHLILQGLTVLDDQGRPTDLAAMGNPLTLAIDVEGLDEIRGAQVGIIIKSVTDQWLVNFNTGMKPPAIRQEGRYQRIVLRVARLPFVPGSYWIDLSVAQKSVGRIDFVERAAQLHISEYDVYGSGYTVHQGDGLVYMDGEWEIWKREGPGVHLRSGGLTEEGS